MNRKRPLPLMLALATMGMAGPGLPYTASEPPEGHKRTVDEDWAIERTKAKRMRRERERQANKLRSLAGQGKL